MGLDLPRPRPAFDSDRLAHLLNALAIIILFIYAAITFGDLPEKIPIHFNTHGDPDGWAAKSWGVWLTLPLVALGLTCLFYATTYLVELAKKHPRWLSLPKKEEFLALPAERQAPIWRKMKTMLYWMAVPLNLMILYAFHTTHKMAAGESESLVMWPVWACMVSILLIAFTLTCGLIHSVRKATER